LKLEKLVSQNQTTMATFLLRRSEDWRLAHKLAFDELEAQIQGKNESRSVRRRWMNDVLGIYQSEWLEMDWKASLNLIFQAALLPNSAELRHASDIEIPADNKNIGEFPKDFLPQTDIIRQLLEHAQQALESNDAAKVRAVTDAAIDMIGAVTSCELEPCPALICFTATLLWRAGDIKEFLAMLRSYIRSSAANTKSYQKTGNAILAEVLIAIVTDVEIGCKREKHDETVLHIHGLDPPKTSKEYLLNEVTEIVSSIASYHTIARHLLSRGHVIDAVTVCSRIEHKLVEEKRRFEERRQEEKAGVHAPTHVQHENALTGEEVFRAAIEQAKNGCDSQADRCRLLYFIHKFIVGWDPVCLAEETRRVAVTRPIRRLSSSKGENSRTAHNANALSRRPSLRASIVSIEFPTQNGDSVFHLVKQSELAHNVPDFPDKLLGGRESPICRQVRKMFGYASLE